jgi:hypothetical protein
MRKKISFWATVLIIVASMNSCGTSKKTLTEETMKKDECIIYAEDANATGLRAWGEALAFSQGDASMNAALQARGKLATSIATLVKDGLSQYNETYRKAVAGGSSEPTALEVLESNGKFESAVSGVSQELLRGCREAKSCFYKRSDGTIRSIVCVEIDIKRVSEQVKQSQELRSVIAEYEKYLIDKKAETFDKSMDNSFEELKKAKAANN